ncbi:MAG: GntR family transcriptional regulator, partial [Desulfococcaceae bacterium]
MTQEVTTETSKEKIYKEVRSDIINGRLRSGARLAVHELASRYGISITPVRDA